MRKLNFQQENIKMYIFSKQNEVQDDLYKLETLNVN